MKTKNFFSIIMILSCMALSGLTLTVSLDGSAQYASIQAAVVAASNGDIVLVYPGTYLENVDYLDKSIAINSLEANTGDSTYISNTIIDGGRQAPCVSFKNGLQNASLRGFTITNGLGALHFTSQMSVGGGILIYNNCNVSITNCDIWGNHALMGAGLILYKSSAVFSGLRIHHNYAASASGGMLLWGHQTYYPNIVFDPNNLCSIYENYGGNPTDIEVTDIHQNLQINLEMASVENPSDFYIQRNSNFIVTADYHDTVTNQRFYRTEVNHDLYVSPDGDNENSGLNPSHALRSITLAMHRIKADCLDRRTVWVMPGTYTVADQVFPIPMKSYVNVIGSESDEVIIEYNASNRISTSVVLGIGKQHDILLSGITIRGTGENGIQVRPLSVSWGLSDSMIHDVVVEDFHLYHHGIVYVSRDCTLSDFTIRNCTTPERAFSTGSSWISGTMKDCVFENIESLNTGDPGYQLTVIDLFVDEEINIENCVFRDIRVQDQQPIFHVTNSRQDNQPVNIMISNTVFDNLRSNVETPITFGNKNVDNFTVSNCTFVGNYGTFATIGTGGKLIFRNNIMHNPDAPKEIYINRTFPFGYTSYIDVDYNIVHGGLSGISNPWMGNILVYGQNNIDADPLFESTNIIDPMYLRLSASSPCINAGTPDTIDLNLPPYDLAGNWRIWDGRIDMGCYEYGSVPWVSNGDPVVPEIPVVNLVAYPNPFQTITNIKISIPIEYGNRMTGKSGACIDIYNIKGQKVKTISLDMRSSLEQITVWDGRDQNGNNCATGLYFVNLTIDGKQVVTRKVTLIK